MVKKKPPTEYDDRGLIEKTVSGDMDKLDVVDGLEAGSLVSDMLPGAGQMISAPLDGIRGSMTSERERNKLERELGGDLKSAATQSRAARKKLDELAGRSEQAAERAGISAAGAIAGGMVAPLAGTFGGQWIAGKMADEMFGDTAVTQDQGAVELDSKLHQMQQQRQPVPAELVFAELAANLPDTKETYLINRLERLTGTRQFSDAVSQGKTAALTQLMREFDNDIRVDTGMPIDPNNPNKTASEQYAELINSGKMDARALIFRDNMPRPGQMVAAQQPAVQAAPPAMQPRMGMQNPEIAGIVADLNQLGVTPAIGEDGQLVLLPNNNKLTPGKV